MRDIAPMIYRQRLVIEGFPKHAITDQQIKDYLKQLSVVLDMKALNEPVAHRSEKFGWAGWIHWETSGAHFYAWEKPQLFFSVDIYTCKKFRVEDAVEFTRNTFQTTELEFQSV